MHKRLACWIAWLGALPLPGLAAPAAPDQPARIWRVCVTNLTLRPWILNDPKQLGWAEESLVAAGRQVGLSVMLLRYPPRRCRAMFEAGGVDATLAGAASANLTRYVFPMRDGRPDAARRVMRATAVWVRRPDSRLDWDGHAMQGGTPASQLLVATYRDVRINIEPLQALGFRVDAESTSTRQILSKVALKRVDLGVGGQEEVEEALRDPALQDLVVMPRAFLVQDIYAVVRPGLDGAQREQVEAWWAAIARRRAQLEAPVQDHSSR